VLVLLALLVMCETGVRWLKYMRCRCQCCRRCDKYCCGDPVENPSAEDSLLNGSADNKAPLLIPEELSGYSDYDESENGSYDDDLLGSLHGSSRLDRFLTADGDFSEEDEETGRNVSGWAERDRLETEELNCAHDSPENEAPPANAEAGSSTSTEEGIAYMWPDFVESFGEAKAKAKFETMIEFRKKNGIDRILEIPHPKFHVFKEAYPFVIHGRSKFGELVSYECPGRMDMSKASAEGVTAEALSGILSAQYEFISLLDLEKQKAEMGDVVGDDFKQRPARCMSIVDIKGISFRAVNKNTFSFLITAGDIMDNYYPKRVARIFIVNVPSWFSGVWSGLSTMLPKSVVDNVRICGEAETTKTLLQFVDIEELPSEYIDDAAMKAFRAEEIAAGKTPFEFIKFGEHPYEKRLCSIVSAAVKRDADEKKSNAKPSSHQVLSQHRSEASALHSLGSEKRGGASSSLGRSQSDKSPRPPSPGHAVAASSRPSAPPDLELPQQTGMRRVSSSPEFVASGESNGDADNSANSSDQPGGILRSDSWLGRFVWPRSKSAHASNSKQMHLGEENKFQYDSLKGEWVLQQVSTVSGGSSSVNGDNGNGSGSPKSPTATAAAMANANGSSSSSSSSLDKPHGLMTSESAVQLDGKLLEEHSIALAIQAAHLAAEWQRVGHHPGSSQKSASQEQAKDCSPSKLSSSHRSRLHGSQTAASATNFKLLVVLVVFYAAMGFVYLGLETVVPLWAFSPPDRGGLGFEPVDAALVLAFVSCALLLQRNLIPQRLAAIPYHAPLRSLRVSVGILFVLCVGAAWMPHPESHSKHRNETAVVWVAVTVLLVGLANAVILGRSATTVMLQVAFKSHPLKAGHKKFIEQMLAISEAAAPLLSAVAFAWVYTLDAPYPLDCTACFNAVAALACVLYTASLVLHAHIGGEAAKGHNGSPSSSGVLSACFRINSCCCAAPGRRCPSCITLPASDVSALLGDASLVSSSRLGVLSSSAHGSSHGGRSGASGSGVESDIPSSLASLSARKTLSMKRV